MRIRIDTDLKTITVEKTTNFGTFMKKIEAMLPNGEWKEYKLEVEYMSNWNPIYVDSWRWMEPQPNNPWQPWTGTSTDVDCSHTLTGTTKYYSSKSKYDMEI
jgi:hypothetical protein